MQTVTPVRRLREPALYGLVLALAGYVLVVAVEYYFHLRSVRRHHLESAWMWFIAATLLFALTARDSSTDDDSAPPGSWAPLTNVTVAMVALAVAFYYPVLRLGFLSDDFALAGLASRNQFFGQSWAFLRPLPLLFYKAAGVAHPAAMHTLVVVLHGVNAALVVRLAAIFGCRPGRCMRPACCSWRSRRTWKRSRGARASRMC